jgi:hypothetical protein
MSNLIPEVRVNKNGVPVTKHINAAEKTTSGAKNLPAPAPVAARPAKRTFAGTVRELEDLGVNLTGYKSRTLSVKLLAKNDPEMLEQVMDAIISADKPTRGVWQTTMGSMSQFTTFYNNISYKRMLANNELTARLISAIGSEVIRNPLLFSTENLALNIEDVLNIRPGNPRYNEVQAGIIYYAITSPEEVSRIVSDMTFLETNRDDIMTIAHNLNKVMSMLPALCKRRDASRHAINGLGKIDAPSLIDGAL